MPVQRTFYMARRVGWEQGNTRGNLAKEKAECAPRRGGMMVAGARVTGATLPLLILLPILTTEAKR